MERLAGREPVRVWVGRYRNGREALRVSDEAKETNAPKCVICGTDRLATHGYVCTSHYERLADTLRALEDEALHLDPRPSMQQRTGSGGGSPASERAPARLTVIAYRDPRTRRWEPDEQPRYTPPAPKSFGPWCLFCDHDTCTAWRAGRRRDLHDDEYDAGSAALASVLDELHNWARLVREERGLAAPQRVTITGERDLMTRQLPWMVEQPWIDECWTDLRRLLGQLQAVNFTAPDKPIGRCYLPDDEGLCNGPIWVDDAAGHAHCGRCRATWDGPYLATLRYEMDKAKAEAVRPRTADGRRMLTIAELMVAWQTSENGVRLRLSRAKARPVLGHYDPDCASKASA